MDTHREGDWTLEAVTGHGLQRLQQIACVKERTAINGCIIQYSVVVYTAIRVCRRECVSVRARVRVHLAAHIRAHRRRVHVCRYIYIYTYVYIDTTEWVHIERGVLCTARGRYCQERLSGAHNPFTNERETDGQNRPRATKRTDICVPVLHPVLGFTFRRVFRRLDIALLQTTAWRARSIIVRHPHLFLSLSPSFFFSLFVPRCSHPLLHVFIAARCRHIPCTSFLCSPPSSCYHRENLSLLHPCPFFFSLSFHLSFFVALLISLDRIDLFMCTAIIISSPGLFFVRPFLRGSKTN